MSNESLRLRDFFTGRREIVALVLSGIVLSLGIEFLASEFIDMITPRYYARILVGFALVLSALIGFGWALFHQRTISTQIDAIIAFDLKKQQIVKIDGYEFSEDIANAINAACIENGAMRMIWREQALRQQSQQPPTLEQNECDRQTPPVNEVSYVLIVRTEKESPADELPASAEILREAAEYVLLEQLSLHLSSYFNDFKKDKLVYEYTRDDVPQILLKNRVLSLLSTPLNERENFLKLATKPGGLPDGEIVSAFGSDGSRFSRFDLCLPLGSDVARPSKNTVTISSPRIALAINVIFDGFSSSIDPSFLALAVGVDPRSVHVFKVQFDVSATIKRAMLLRGSGWKYYEWLDSFMDRARTFACFDTYFASLGWTSIELQAQMNARMMRRFARNFAATPDAVDREATVNDENKKAKRAPSPQKRAKKSE